MKRKLFCIMLLILYPFFIVTACQNQTELIYTGESDNWKAQIVVMHLDDTEIKKFVLKYQGESLKNVVGNEIIYEIKTNNSSSSGMDVLTNRGILESEVGNCSGCAFVQDDDVFEVTVEWNDTHENIDLINKNK